MDNKSIDKFKNDLKEILGGNQELIEKILVSLDENRIIQYSSPGETALLSTAGRIVFTLLEDPSITQRAMAIYLGISETMVEKTIKMLSEKGLITKTKVNRKNVYRFNTNILLENPDIQRIPLILYKVLELE
jgi:transcription initiation factor IIE alpha subunit